jgi:hypothetical protein
MSSLLQQFRKLSPDEAALASQRSRSSSADALEAQAAIREILAGFAAGDVLDMPTGEGKVGKNAAWALGNRLKAQADALGIDHGKDDDGVNRLWIRYYTPKSGSCGVRITVYRPDAPAAGDPPTGDPPTGDPPKRAAR